MNTVIHNNTINANSSSLSIACQWELKVISVGEPALQISTDDCRSPHYKQQQQQQQQHEDIKKETCCPVKKQNKTCISKTFQDLQQEKKNSFWLSDDAFFRKYIGFLNCLFSL